MQVDEGRSACEGRRGWIENPAAETRDVTALSQGIGEIRLDVGSSDDRSLSKRMRAPAKAEPIMGPPRPQHLSAALVPSAPSMPETWTSGRTSNLPTPSIGDLEPAGDVVEPPVPPLPKFNAAAGRPQVKLIVDGVSRRGYVGDDGGIHLTEIPHFSIGSDHEGEELPCFAEARNKGGANPFQPAAGSPFKPVVVEERWQPSPSTPEETRPPPP